MFAKTGKDGMYKASSIGKHFEQHMIPPGGAFHFDAHKIGQYFKKILGDAVTVIDAKIEKAGVNIYGHIDRVYLDDGRSIGGDFFIDCTGFKRVLINELKVGWKSYSMNLPVDRAMPFILPYKENVQVEPLTVAHALSSGWMWQIPTATRLGCGYVFQSSCLTPDQAQQELEKTLGCKIEPIKVINFDSGRSQSLWQGNCLALGLAAAFAEPLEATSIHTTIIQLLNFTFEYLTEDFNTTVIDTSIRRYNEKMTKMYDDILDFLVIHYQGGRVDSEFWQWISKGNTLTSFAAEVLERSKYKIPGVLNFDYYYGCIGAPLWNWVLAGIGRITPEQAIEELTRYQKL
jgi:tryptophan halogenase